MFRFVGIGEECAGGKIIFIDNDKIMARRKHGWSREKKNSVENRAGIVFGALDGGRGLEKG